MHDRANNPRLYEKIYDRRYLSGLNIPGIVDILSMAALFIPHLDFISHVDKTPLCLVYTCDFFDANYLIVVRLCQPRHSFFTIFNHEKSSHVVLGGKQPAT